MKIHENIGKSEYNIGFLWVKFLRKNMIIENSIMSGCIESKSEKIIRKNLKKL